ncbi:MAG: DUF192 domain-containing protein [Candidatus Omnitrophota bacterium]|nr:DUF192 domain-containing protein [Candidatus Omnitrophota bacterium]
MYKIINPDTKVIIAEHAEFADNFFSRMKGLLFRDSLDASTALIIKPASSLHTFFMRFSIDIIFLDSQNRILKLSSNVTPFKFVLSAFGAKCAVELPAGTIEKFSLSIGGQLSIIK